MSWQISRDSRTGRMIVGYGDEFPPIERFQPSPGDRFNRVDLQAIYVWDGDEWTAPPAGPATGLVVQEVDGVPSAEVDTILFDEGDGFVLTDMGDGSIRVDLAAVPETQLALNFPTHDNALDHSNANDPSAGEKAALAGTSGTPGGANRYVTDADARNTNVRVPSAHAVESSGGFHTASGLTIGHVMRASGAGSFAFAAIQDADVPSTIARDSEVTAAVAAHEGAADPHTGYQRESEKDAASGYAGLDANARLVTTKLQVSATARFVGRLTAGAGAGEELTGTQATTLLDAFTSGLKGLAPASGGGTANFLRADGTWTAPTASVASPFTGAQAPGDFTVADAQFGLHGRRLTLTGTQRGTIAGSGRLIVSG